MNVGGSPKFACGGPIPFVRVWWRINGVPLEQLGRNDIMPTLNSFGVGILTIVNVSSGDNGAAIWCSGLQMFTGVVLNSTNAAVLIVNGELNNIWGYVLGTNTLFGSHYGACTWIQDLGR